MKKALVIDDVREVADSICELLSLLDIQATAAYGSLAALSTFMDYVPDIVFVDIHMPGVDGMEVISFIRREPRFFEVPLVVITSDDQPEIRKTVLEAGVLDVIVKPVTYEALERVVRLIGFGDDYGN